MATRRSRRQALFIAAANEIAAAKKIRPTPKEKLEMHAAEMRARRILDGRHLPAGFERKVREIEGGGSMKNMRRRHAG